MLSQHSHAQAHIRVSGVPFANSPARIAEFESAEGKPHLQPMLAAQGDERFRMWQKPSGARAQEVQIAYMSQGIGNGGEVPRALCVGQRFVGKATRASDFAERPQR